MQLIWIADSEEKSAGLCRSALEQRFRIEIFTSVEAIDRAFGGVTPDLLLAEPQVWGGAREFARFEPIARQPCFVISSLRSLDAIEECFAAGVEDYLTKPLERNLLIAKVRRRLSRESFGPVEHASGLRLDAVVRQVQNSEGERVTLTPKEFQVLNLLCGVYPAGVSRRGIFRGVWSGVSVSTKTLDVHLFMLRKKLELLGYEIRCEAGAVYRLICCGKRCAPA